MFVWQHGAIPFHSRSAVPEWLRIEMRLHVRRRAPTIYKCGPIMCLHQVLLHTGHHQAAPGDRFPLRRQRNPRSAPDCDFEMMAAKEWSLNGRHAASACTKSEMGT